ncbi:hypothetical protein A3Q56_04652 [Intoshia linei]|uniref:Phosphatidylinositol 3-kinase catalytic subunit type 3 n=1 Tax=Intoshia linei TaxID=1819745 RepID=A0A177B009_9BILA|nr:hypothetical protein A3Q56_04652 [Intoshia linei]
MRGLSDFPNLYDKDCSTYMMKTCGKNQYLFDEVPIISYTFVEEMVFEKKEISFLLIHQDEIYKKGYTVASDLTLSAKKLDRINKVISYHKRFDYEIEYDCLLVDQVSYCESSESDCDEYEQNLDTMNIDDNIEDSLDIDTVVEKPFQIEILTVNSNTLSMNNNTLPDHGVFYFQIAMFIGTTRLTEYFNTTKVDSVYLNWRSLYDLNIDYRDVCRDAYISFRLLHMLKKTGKVAKHLFWLNIPVYDEKGCPTMGEISHRMWKFQSKVEDFDCPGTIQECGDTSAPILNVRFKVQKLVDFRIEDNLNKIIDKILSKNKIKPVRIENGVVSCDSETEPSAYFTEMYKWFFVDKLGPPLNSVQKKMFWKDRYYFANHPEVLVQYMQIVKWTDMKCINEFYAFLQLFDHVGLRFALALLDNRFVDTRIRKFAVDSLRKHCKDEEIILYMIQLIQALKAEKYLDNALIFFLLERSWSNARVGHCFYWTLSTECADPYYKNRFNIFLYIYCRYCGEFSHSLVNQVTALRRLNILAVHMKYNSTDLDHVLQRELSNPEIKAAVSNFISPINISHQHGKIIPHLCKVMTSKKKPLWLVWENSDPQSHLYYKEYNLIFKSGDDLRQDMLTLQMFRVLDRIWKDIGVDVKLIPYGCQSIGHDVGVIEVVRGSCTLYAIQKSAVMSAMQINSAGLLKWIKLNHSTADEYRKAIQNFTYSCAGYCVATYILGIRDRHNDNIMLTKSGHVFHIDFGHFLNHKKKKLGIIRERVPFILTNDFLNVITNGKDNPLETNEFKIFTKICHKIYAALFDSHQFFINIFLMMIPSGIEELSVKDIEYLRQILCVSLSLKDARNYFDADMLVSINMSWTTKVDWFWHWTAHK